MTKKSNGADGGINAQYPLRVFTDGYVYEHEVGFAYGGAMPYLESGPFELGSGDQVQICEAAGARRSDRGRCESHLLRQVRARRQRGQLRPYALSKLTDVCFGGRQIRVQYGGVNLDGWRIGARSGWISWRRGLR